MGKHKRKRDDDPEGESCKKKHKTSLPGNAILENARPICNKPIPPAPVEVPDRNGKMPVTLLLFYQYVEPSWNKSEHRAALSYVINLAKKHDVKGRGRCAPEGLNCTLTGPAQGVRAFCQGLRDWNRVFEETDFKFTDGLENARGFKALTIRKTEELVAYGLKGETAPSIKSSTAKHLDADKYHEMMTKPDTVIIDVRNRYESQIGHFQPPPGGAELLDPLMRNSYEFPKWLNSEETKQKLKGKNVMMYCTAGIRCERATALLDQLTKKDEEYKVGEIVMARGGVERYLKTFPDGGFWKGKNYVFDRRLVQVPEKKPMGKVEDEIESTCCVCDMLWDEYRGKLKCSRKDCGVPVLVCDDCQDKGAHEDPDAPLLCPLCQEGVRLRDLARPELEASIDKPAVQTKKPKVKAAGDPSERLFLGNLPFTTTFTTISEALGGGVELVQWIRDRKTGMFYGSAFVKMDTLEQARRVVEGPVIRVGGRKIRVNFSPPKGEWPPADFKQRELPPVM